MRRITALVLAVLLTGAAAGADPSPEADPAAAIYRKLAPYFRPPPELAGDFGAYRSPLAFYDATPVLSAAQWPRRREEILSKWHELMGPWPAHLDQPKLELLEQQRQDRITLRHLRIEVAPSRLTDDAWLLLPDGPGPFPAVVVVYYDAKTGIGQGRPDKSPLRDFALQLARRGFVALSLGSAPETYYPDKQSCRLQPLSFHAYEAATCHTILSNLEQVDPQRIGIVGHSYGGKWAMFASCLYDKFACAAWSDGGIVFDEERGNVNYWERWYLGFEPGQQDRQPGIPSDANPRSGAYKALVEGGHDLHELHALMAPRPLLVSGGSEDRPERWRALNHAVAVNELLGFKDRVAMTNRQSHSPTPESNELLYLFFEYFLKHGKALAQ